jgi:hexosaminidase
MPSNKIQYFLLCLILFTGCMVANAQGTELWSKGISIIPYPQKVEIKGEAYRFKKKVAIFIDKDSSPEDKFTAEELGRQLQEQFNIGSNITTGTPGKGIVLSRHGAATVAKAQAYHLSVRTDQVKIQASDAAGLFYGMQTLLQLIQNQDDNLYIAGLTIEDWPDIEQRAVHYDSKHFQERFEYVKGFIRTLATYKINMLIWEWEDKFAYPSHPEIGAPGAFTMEEIQALTSYARQYHIQIVPLVQGLGHVSYLMKWPQHKHLREVASSNWELCPLKDGSYELLYDLWEDAMDATPGSEYIHIGTDESWELGHCEKCKAKSEEIGISGLYHLFIKRSGEYLQEKGRKVMCWEGPMEWKMGKSPARGIEPLKNLVLTDIYRNVNQPFKNVKQANEEGYETFIYDPNPGIEHMFLPYFYRLYFAEETQSHIERSYNGIKHAAASGYYKGMISTSWNCSGVHNQIWMLRYITAAEYSWSSGNPDLPEFEDKYFVNYYGPTSLDVKELFIMLNKASYFYMNAFERKVWHWGEVGKTHLPDLPRDDIEYDPFWNTEYSEMIEHSRMQLAKMDRVLEICDTNLSLDAKQPYDFELFRGIAELFRHTANTYLAFSELENKIKKSHELHFRDHDSAYFVLAQAYKIAENNLLEREQVFSRIKTTWEKHQFSKGMSLPGKEYLHARDRQRNFANRRPDLSFMIYDEELLGLEKYIQDLSDYMAWYKTNYLNP